MQHFSPVIVSVVLAFSFTGCSLPMNPSQQEQNIYWYMQNIGSMMESKHKLTQGLTIYLAMGDTFQSIASRIHLISKSKI